MARAAPRGGLRSPARRAGRGPGARGAARAEGSSGKGFGRRRESGAREEREEPEQSGSDTREEEAEESEPPAPDTLPQEVADRMLRRMVAFAGAPAAVVLSALPLARYLESSGALDIRAWQVLLFTGALFAASIAGVTYGAVSASWDPARAGSLLGWSEAKVNVPAFLNRNKRSR